MPNYAEERGYHTPAPADQKDWKAKAMAAEAKLKEKEKELAKERKRHSSLWSPRRLDLSQRPRRAVLQQELRKDAGAERDHGQHESTRLPL